MRKYSIITLVLALFLSAMVIPETASADYKKKQDHRYQGRHQHKGYDSPYYSYPNRYDRYYGPYYSYPNRYYDRYYGPYYSYPNRYDRYYGPYANTTAKVVQRVLKSEGLYAGPIDGIIGPTTRAALREYQWRHHLRVTGYLDKPTLWAMGVIK